MYRIKIFEQVFICNEKALKYIGVRYGGIDKEWIDVLDKDYEPDIWDKLERVGVLAVENYIEMRL